MSRVLKCVKCGNEQEEGENRDHIGGFVFEEFCTECGACLEEIIYHPDSSTY